MSDYETQTASKRYQKSLKIEVWGVRDALGGGLGIPLPPWAAQIRKRDAKPGSWLTRASPFGIQNLIFFQLLMFFQGCFRMCFFHCFLTDYYLILHPPDGQI